MQPKLKCKNWTKFQSASSKRRIRSSFYRISSAMSECRYLSVKFWSSKPLKIITKFKSSQMPHTLRLTWAISKLLKIKSKSQMIWSNKCFTVRTLSSEWTRQHTELSIISVKQATKRIMSMLGIKVQSFHRIRLRPQLVNLINRTRLAVALRSCLEEDRTCTDDFWMIQQIICLNLLR